LHASCTHGRLEVLARQLPIPSSLFCSICFFGFGFVLVAVIG
jgi:hypothetical protein